jgi:cardiolipin synthase
MEAIADVFFTAITSARKQALLVTPYFVPPRDIVRALRTAALRGVDVRIILPEENNHFYTGLASRALYEELLDAGVRIFERHPPFMHAKALIVDSSIAIIGTSNFDVRSLRLNYETDLVVYDDKFIDKLKQIALEDMALSSEVDLRIWQTRSTFSRMFENLAYLMMPVL